MNKLTDYEQELLTAWEEVYKKGQLTLWVMLALKDGPKHMAQIKRYISEAAGNAFLVEDKSLYRSLRRYYDVEMLAFTAKPGSAGPDRKVYRLTETGEKLLKLFAQRNVASLLSDKNINELMKESNDV